MFGKDCDDLQSDINVADGKITGTLKYIADYSSAFGPGLDSGNYIALHAESDEDDVTITAEVDNVNLVDPADGNIILRIADKDSQKIKFVANKEGHAPAVKVFNLKDLTCLDS